MQVLVSGASGFVGSALVPALERGGHLVLRLSRAVPRGASGVRWDPEAGTLDRAPLAGIDAAIHLAGESIGARRWSAAHKARVRESRVAGTRLLSETLAGLDRPPRVLVSASAVGIYGDRGDEVLDEASPPGLGFLAEVAREWEAATVAAERRDVRVVRLRIGMVLGPHGGALARLLPPFQLGLGGPMGRGRQWMSWIALDDLIGAILHALSREDLRGAVNAVAPEPVTHREFARTLGRVMQRPALLPAPAFALRLLLGREMADELLLASQRVLPRRLLESGYRYRLPTLAGALRHALGAVTTPTSSLDAAAGGS